MSSTTATSSAVTTPSRAGRDLLPWASLGGRILLAGVLVLAASSTAPWVQGFPMS